MTYSAVCATNVCFSQYRTTGKERDLETGDDYFEARYYSSNLGRFMSPDWSAKEEPVPYADLDDPQSLNLYSYVRNNPLSKTDPDGHDGCCDALTQTADELSQSFGPDAAPVSAVLKGIALGAAVVGAVWENRDAIGDGLLATASAYSQAGGPASTGMYPTTFNSDAPPNSQAPTSSSGGPTAGAKFTPKDRAEDAGKNCVYCGRATTEEPGKSNTRETDHGDPRVKGGNRTKANRNPACRTCNRQKGKKSQKEFKEWQKKNPDKVPKPTRFHRRFRPRFRNSIKTV